MNQSAARPLCGRWIRYSLLSVATVSVLTFLAWRGFERYSAIQYFEDRGGQVVTEPVRPALLNDVVVATFGNKLTDVRTVSVQDTGVGDAAVDNLVSLTRPEFAATERLNLENTNVTDASLVHLSGLKKLKRLVLENTGVTDTGLSHVSTLTSLQGLNLEATHITDAGLPKLENLTLLQELSLNKTRVSDDGLRHLWVHTGLISLDLRNTDVTESGVADLKSRLPNCKVLHATSNP
jgi:hypothetical protein